MQTFMHTSEGDGCMPWHITVCLTTHADGKLFVKWLIVVFLGGACAIVCKVVDCFFGVVCCS